MPTKHLTVYQDLIIKKQLSLVKMFYQLRKIILHWYEIDYSFSVIIYPYLWVGSPGICLELIAFSVISRIVVKSV